MSNYYNTLVRNVLKEKIPGLKHLQDFVAEGLNPILEELGEEPCKGSQVRTHARARKPSAHEHCLRNHYVRHAYTLRVAWSTATHCAHVSVCVSARAHCHLHLVSHLHAAEKILPVRNREVQGRDDSNV